MNEFMEKAWKTLSKLPQRPKTALAVVIGILIGVVLHQGLSPAKTVLEEPAVQASGEQTAEVKTWWTCSMHPEIRLSKPGLCPKCRMKLIPVRDQSDGMTGMRQLAVSENARALMDVETAAVERKFVTAQIRMVGKVEYDETRLAYLTAWVPGRLDRLYVDYTGVSVNKGDHMVYLYSPELLIAQEELLQAIQAVQNVKDSESKIIREVTAGTLVAAREKLRLWGLNPEQIEEIEERKTVSDHITIYAPTSGVVIHRSGQLGMYVKTGTRIYTIADLSHVWVKLDAYESDLMWLRYGQEVEFATVSYPGELFKGTISFIDPVLNPATRTVKIRVNVPNADGRLKPEMFVKAVAHAQIAGGGKIMDASLAGKWICPMHPEIIKDTSGTCDICEMPLRTTESLGYLSVDPDTAEKPLVIPVTAALVTGTRAIVYVKLPDTKVPTFEGREIVLGPRAGDYYLVRSGLKEGELVVVKGNFKIDSDLQIMARPSMMTPDGAGGGLLGKSSELPAQFQYQLQSILAATREVEKALAGKDITQVQSAFAAFDKSVKDVDMKLLTGNTHMLWMEMDMRLSNDALEGIEVGTLEEARRIGRSMADNIKSLKSKFGLKDEISRTPRPSVSDAFRSQLLNVFAGYFTMQQGLTEDKAEAAAEAAQQTLTAIKSVDMKLLTGNDHNLWMKCSTELESILSQATQTTTLKSLRESFHSSSQHLIKVAKRFGSTGEKPFYMMNCPMAFDNTGADWLQHDDQTRNPYFGQMMLQCGGVKEVIAVKEIWGKKDE